MSCFGQFVPTNQELARGADGNGPPRTILRFGERFSLIHTTRTDSYRTVYFVKFCVWDGTSQFISFNQLSPEPLFFIFIDHLALYSYVRTHLSLTFVLIIIIVGSGVLYYYYLQEDDFSQRRC